MSLNKPVIRQWIRDLMSGTYKQGIGRLKYQSLDGDGSIRYCCLGVLCEQAVLAGKINRGKVHDGSGYYVFGKDATDQGEDGGKDSLSLLPDDVIEWVAFSRDDLFGSDVLISEDIAREILTDISPFRDSEVSAFTLTVLNDTIEASFLSIAEILRLQYLPDETMESILAGEGVNNDRNDPASNGGGD